MNTRQITATIAAAVLAASVALACGAATAAPAAAAGPYSLVSAASPTAGIDEAAGTFTADATFTPIRVGSTTGYGELTTPDGKCMTYVSTTSTVAATCSSTNTKDLWWVVAHGSVFVIINDFYGAPNTQCPWTTGHTQAVLKASGGNLTEACDDSPSGTAWPYGTDEEWSEQPPVTASPSASPSPSSSPSSSPSPTPSPSPSSTPPPDGCPTVTAPAVTAGPDIPNAAHVGALETNLTGADLVNEDWTQTEYDAMPYTLDRPSLAADGSADLHTDGGYQEETSVSSCSSVDGSGGNYEFGIVEVTAQFPVSGSACQDFGAIWLSNPVQADWPAGNEIDIVECLGGSFQSHFHYGGLCGGNTCFNPGGPAEPVTAGYHTWDLIWAPGSLTVFQDGVQQWQFVNSAVTGSVPLELIIDNACPFNSTCSKSDLDVTSARVWAWQ